jgi:protein-S-isoprenylcysteine O-methyltransferase Ste14
MAWTPTDRQKQAGVVILACLSVGVILWWVALFFFSTVRDWFFAESALRGGWFAFVLPDGMVLAGGGVVAMLGMRRNWPIVGPLLWLLVGGWAYAFGWCVLSSVSTGQAWPAVGAMGLATLLIAALAVQWLPDDTAGHRLAPIQRTAWQVVAFWSVFLIVLPAGLVAVETSLGWEVIFFQGLVWRLMGLFVLIAASALGLFSGAYMAWYGRGTPLPLDPTKHLVTTGPYAIVRNPMAVAGLAQGLAVGMLLGSWMVIAYALLGGPVWHFLVRPWEERKLNETFGETYEQYQSAVRCWLPGRFARSTKPEPSEPEQ